jgi:hypothetical protein
MLLDLHDDCAVPDPIMEDYLVHHLDKLGAYADAVHASWNPTWAKRVGREDLGEFSADLKRSLGEGILRFLDALTSGRRPIPKTPSTRSLSLLRQFFPDSPIFLLVRDGRAVVESATRSTSVTPEVAARRWAEGVTRALDFVEREKEARASSKLVRYEDLVTAPRKCVEEILELSKLSADRYRYDDIETLPVKGSSTFRGGDKKEIHWNPVQRTAEFDPLSRFSHWTADQHRRFDSIAGTELRRLGYVE